MKLNFEAHVTIEPVEGVKLENFERICKKYKFKPATLVMVKDRKITDERSNRDSFATGWGDDESRLLSKGFELVDALRAAGFKVWRLKVEKTLTDIDFRDEAVREKGQLPSNSCTSLV